MLSETRLADLAAELVAVPGVVAVLRGGSRARGTHAPGSDVDLGVYYRRPLDTDALGALARRVAGPRATVTRPGEWGQWVDGGAWLRVDDVPVDWIYRDVDRVAAVWDDVRAGRFAIHRQVGHPFGFVDFAYVGEVALGRVLADPGGELRGLHEAARVMPAALQRTVVPAALWEAECDVTNAAKAVARGDTVFVAGCLFHATVLCAHALHARAGRWLVHEQGAVGAAGELDLAPVGFAERAHDLVARLRDPEGPGRAVEQARGLVADTAAACRSDGPD